MVGSGIAPSNYVILSSAVTYVDTLGNPKAFGSIPKAATLLF
jgi:hypothetical protein